MDPKYASLRLGEVAKTDSVTSTQGDFLATHVAMKNLLLPEQFSLIPTGARSCHEETVFSDIIANRGNRHQFIAVYGQSGTGKSHLIRWFETKFEQIRPDNEVVLFIRRSDNTLKGTIRQLIEKPEVRGIRNRETYDRLVRASATVDESKLKDMIYHNFIIEVDHDDGSHGHTLTSILRRHLTAFLNNETIHSHMMRVDGPVARIYSKVAQSDSIVDRDVVAQFLPEDFEIDVDLADAINKSGADRNVLKLIHKLTEDDGAEFRAELAAYMNQFVSTVVQRCAGIEPGDFRDIFNDIRRELYRLGKNLTLFIEDVTSFTGVDDALLDALIVDHNGTGAGDRLCRISSIVGTTGDYLGHNFRDNHRDRITNFIYIPGDAFDDAGREEFVARYLNTMSLPEEAIDRWVSEYGAAPDQYPVHEPKEGTAWESVGIGNGKSLSLYPFTRHSIRYLYEHALTRGQQTPRYIIRDIIEPFVGDVLRDRNAFPCDGNYCRPLLGYDQSLPELISNQLSNQKEQDRMLRFLSVWGNGRPEISVDVEPRQISGIPETYFREFGLPVIHFDRTVDAGSQKQSAQVVPVPGKTEAQAQPISDDKLQRYNAAYALLQRWRAGEAIDFSVKTGAVGVLNQAMGTLNEYAWSAINWQDWGVSADHQKRVRDGRARLIGLERQTRGDCLYALPSDWDSVYLLCAIIQYNVYGGNSWNYPDAGADVYRLTSWLERTRDTLVCAVRDINGKPAGYIDAAIAAEIWRLILSGEYGEHTLRNLTPQHMLQPGQNRNTQGHCSKWLALLSLMAKQDMDAQNRDAIRKYFDIPQGTGGNVIVLNEPLLSQTFGRIKRLKLKLPPDEVGQLSNDPVRPRGRVYDYLKEIEDRVGDVAQQEKQTAEECLREIEAGLETGSLTEDDLLNLVKLSESFYTTANDTQFNVARPSALTEVRRSAAGIAKAAEAVHSVADEQDPLTILMAYSGERNPIRMLSPLQDLLKSLSADLKKVEQAADKRRTALAGFVPGGMGSMREPPFLQLDADLARLEGRM